MVYVDDMEAPFGRMIMCHMIADTTEELLAMADQIGVARRHIQRAGTRYEHFDICKSMKARAIELGACPITKRQAGLVVLGKRRLVVAHVTE